MKLIKPFLLGLLGLFIFSVLLSLLIPAQVRVNRITSINASPNQVFTQILQLNNWKNWHPMFKSAEASIQYSGTAYKADQACSIKYHGKTTHLQFDSINATSLFFTLSNPGENDIHNEIDFHPDNSPNLTAVTWVATIHLKWYPWEKFYGIFMDKLAGPGYDAALAGLKEYVEKTR